MKDDRFDEWTMDQRKDEALARRAGFASVDEWVDCLNDVEKEMSDFRQQQELEEQRMACLLAILDRVASGQTNEQDAADLAAELGLGNEWRKHDYSKGRVGNAV